MNHLNRGGLESPPNPQTGKSALRRSPPAARRRIRISRQRNSWYSQGMDADELQELRISGGRNSVVAALRRGGSFLGFGIGGQSSPAAQRRTRISLLRNFLILLFP